MVVDFGGGYWTLNAFRTIDKGLVFVDCAGAENPTNRPSNMDTTVEVSVGKPYMRVAMVVSAEWYSSYNPGGAANRVDIYW